METTQVPSPSRFDELPYFQEYVDHVLKPRVSRLIDRLEPRLAEWAWKYVIDRIVGEQKTGVAASPDAVRALLEEQLGLTITIQVSGAFEREPGEMPASPIVVTAETTAPESPLRESVQVVTQRRMPDNPLARAVGGMRKV